MAKQVLTRYRQWIEQAPDELTSSVLLVNYPAVPAVPEKLRGQSFALVRGLYCGPPDQGEPLLRFWRDWHPPAMDAFRTMPFAEVATISNDPTEPVGSFSTGAWLRGLDDQAIDILVEAARKPEGASNPLLLAEIRHVGGAVARADGQGSAYGNRAASLLLELLGAPPDRPAHEAAVAYTDRIRDRLRPFCTGGVYPNFLEGEELHRRAADGFAAASYRRLGQLKAAYDPERRLRSGFDLT